jgi:hypothetical protein
MELAGGVISAIAGGLVAAFASWAAGRGAAIERFFTEATGATYAREKADDGTGRPDMAEHLAGVVLPMAEALGSRIARLDQAANSWAGALSDGDAPGARREQANFRSKARLAALWPF